MRHLCAALCLTASASIAATSTQAWADGRFGPWAAFLAASTITAFGALAILRSSR